MFKKYLLAISILLVIAFLSGPIGADTMHVRVIVENVKSVLPGKEL